MKWKFISLAFVFFSTAASAKPVYLSCKVSNGKDTKVFSTKLDELSGKVTHSGKSGEAFNTEGFFAANKISYQRVSVGGGIKISYMYEIDRTTLDVQEVFSAEPSDPKMALEIPGTKIVMSGACEIEEVTERKI